MDETELEIKRGIVDWPTSGLLFVMMLGFPILVHFQHAGVISPYLALFLATMLMNLSFTAWHEPSHGNYSRFRIINTIAGVLASLLSVYPGYFARRREHLAHHKWEGVEGMDPVYSRIQSTNRWLFPIHLVVRDILGTNPAKIPDNFCRYTKVHRISDSLSNLTALAIIVFALVTGYHWEILCCWVIPRGLVLIVHAYYICFFPHALPAGGYRKYRVRKMGLFWRFITVDQIYHGFHHKWPFIPWHCYSSLFSNKKSIELAKSEIEFIE